MKYVDKYVLLEQKEYDRLLEKVNNMEGQGSQIKSQELPSEKVKDQTPSEKQENIIDQLKSVDKEEDRLDKGRIETLQNILMDESEQKPPITFKAPKSIKTKRPPPPPGIPDKKRKIIPTQKHEWSKFWHS